MDVSTDGFTKLLLKSFFSFLLCSYFPWFLQGSRKPPREGDLSPAVQGPALLWNQHLWGTFPLHFPGQGWSHRAQTGWGQRLCCWRVGAAATRGAPSGTVLAKRTPQGWGKQKESVKR